MAEGLQYKENLTLISGGYPGENPGSDGVVQNWTETTGYSGSSTVTYHYNDSAQMANANSTYVEINITDNWTAVKDNRNYYHITVSTTINYIRRTRVGSPSPLSVYMFARHDAGSANIWTSGGCVDAANSGTNATNINMGTTTIDLAPGQSTNVHGTVYFRSNICGHNNAKPPSIYVDEFWLGVNFRNTLPPDYRPGKTWNGAEWISHNREAGSYVGKNKFDVQRYYDGVKNDKSAATLTFGDDAITWINTTNDSYFPGIWNHGGFSQHQDDATPVESNTTYTLSCAISDNIGNGRVYVYEGDASYNGINNDHVGQITNVHNAALTFTTSATTKYIIVRFARWESTSHAVTLSSIQLEKGSSATSYVPYKQYFSAGATDIYTSATSKNTMRTQDGGVGTNNPPYARHNDDTWRNQRKIGIE